MSLFAQALLDTHDELIVDLFAGGGGASSGIEEALGRMVDIAINHNAKAVEMHRANHPQTEHFVSDVFEVEPRLVTQGRSIGLLWASPDCTFHSKARGAKPIREKTKKRRALAWVVTRWAGQVKPRVIMLENVEEFAKWGPLRGPKDNLRPCPKRKGKTFRRWVKSLTDLGYVVEWKELRACDYGTPTIRKRLFLIARCDGKPIVWPEATHGDPNAKGFKGSGLKPWRAIAECIDWTIPMLSIFATKEEAKEWAAFHGVSAPIRPLADKSMSRIARGVKKFVLDNPKPFLVSIAHGDNGRWSDGTASMDKPVGTMTAKGSFAVVSPFVAGVGGRQGQSPERGIEQPMQTVTAKADSVLVSPFTTPRYGEREGQEPRCGSVEVPSPVIVPSANGSSLCAANLVSYHSAKGTEARGSEIDGLIPTIDTQNRFAVVASFMAQNNSGFNEGAGRSLDDPGATILANSTGHFGLIAAHCNTINNSGNPLYGADQPSHTIVATGAAHTVVGANLMTNTSGSVGSKLDEPVPTLTTGNHQYMVAAFMAKYYGTTTGQSVDEPADTICGTHHHALVEVMIGKEKHVINDIGMRMLQPKELYLAQGFRPGYIFDHYFKDGKRIPITKTEQVKMCGNSVCPPMARALVKANLPDMIVRKAGRVA